MEAVTDPHKLMMTIRPKPITIERPTYRNYRMTDEQLSNLFNADFMTSTNHNKETRYTLQPSYFTSTQITKRLVDRHLQGRLKDFIVTPSQQKNHYIVPKAVYTSFNTQLASTHDGTTNAISHKQASSLRVSRDNRLGEVRAEHQRLMTTQGTRNMFREK